MAEGASANATATRTGRANVICGRHHQTRYRTAQTEASQMLRVSPSKIETDKTATAVQLAQAGNVRSEKKICARTKQSTLSCSAPNVIQWLSKPVILCPT